MDRRETGQRCSSSDYRIRLRNFRLRHNHTVVRGTSILGCVAAPRAPFRQPEPLGRKRDAFPYVGTERPCDRLLWASRSLSFSSFQIRLPWTDDNWELVGNVNADEEFL